MSLAEVQKIQIIAHAGMKMDFLSSLQEEGLVQIEKSDFEELELASAQPDVSHLDHRLFRLSHSLNYLSQWEEGGVGKRLFGQKPQVSRNNRAESLSFDYNPVLDKVDKIEREKNDLLSHIKFLEREEEFLSPLENLGLPVTEVKSTDSTDVCLGVIPLSRFDEYQEMAEQKSLWFHTIDQTKRSVFLLGMYYRKDKADIEQSLKEMNFSPLFFTDAILKRADGKDSVSDVMEKISKEIDEKKEKLDFIDNEGKNLSVHREKLMAVYDVLQNEREKVLSSRLLGETERIFFLEGWVCSSEINRLKIKLRPYSDFIEFYFRPPFPDEDPPSILENPKAGKPFELITKLYGLPQRGSLDPTLFLAPFFFLFVGITVSEAGYGLLVTLLSLLYLKFAKPKGGFRQFLQLLSLLGVSTVILGTLIGGWFGFPLRKLMILDPLQDPVSFLALSLALGFIQVWFGTLLRLITEIKNKDYLQAIFVQGGWLILLPFLVLYGLTRQSLWGIFSLVGAAGIVFFASPSRNPLSRFFGGLYSLYDISRYLADVLSYSRLLALGLATSVIAMVVNTLCQTALGIPWVGWLLAALIFVGGHLFNLGISFLGGFVHSMRLQFVEFFSKFFKSGGRPFKPFELESKYVEFF